MLSGRDKETFRIRRFVFEANQCKVARNLCCLARKLSLLYAPLAHVLSRGAYLFL